MTSIWVCQTQHGFDIRFSIRQEPTATSQKRIGHRPTRTDKDKETKMISRRTLRGRRELQFRVAARRDGGNLPSSVMGVAYIHQPSATIQGPIWPQTHTGLHGQRRFLAERAEHAEKGYFGRYAKKTGMHWKGTRDTKELSFALALCLTPNSHEP